MRNFQKSKTETKICEARNQGNIMDGVRER